MEGVDRRIKAAIADGERAGASALEPLDRAIFLVSELEVSWDMEGIDSFFERYGAPELGLVAGLLKEAGAKAMAEGLERIAGELPGRDDALLTEVNDLVQRRSGYDYESLAAAVAGRVAVERR